MDRLLRSVLASCIFATFAITPPGAMSADHSESPILLDSGSASLIFIPPLTSDQGGGPTRRHPGRRPRSKSPGLGEAERLARDSARIGASLMLDHRRPNGEVVAAGPDGVFLMDGANPISLDINVVDPTAIAISHHGQLFVADRGAPGAVCGPPGSPPALVRFDLETGAETLITSGGHLQDPAAILFVPEPNASVLLATGAGVLGLLSRRRSLQARLKLEGVR